MSIKYTVPGITGITRRSALIRWARLFICGCLGAVMLAACMRFPASTNDFSEMENDFFSVLIQKSSNQSKSGSGIYWYKIDQLSREFFLGKTYSEVNETFLQAQGHCDSSSQPNVLTCDVVRSWKRRDVYPPHNVVSNSGLKLVYRFVLSESKTVVDCQVDDRYR